MKKGTEQRSSGFGATQGVFVGKSGEERAGGIEWSGCAEKARDVSRGRQRAQESVGDFSGMHITGPTHSHGGKSLDF